MNAESTKILDRNKFYIINYDGIDYNASTKGALNMAQHGFKVKDLISGLDWLIRDV